MTDPDRLAQDYARVMAERDTAVAEVARLKRGYGQELMDTEEQLALALGLREDPDYGYPTGDHTTVTLAAQVRGEVERLRTRVHEAEAEVRNCAEALECARKDRAWEMKRANEAARLSAAARDEADDLRRQIDDLEEHIDVVEADRTDRDAWAVALVLKHDLAGDRGEPYGAIARGLEERQMPVIEAAREQRWWVDEDGEEWLIENDDDVDYWREHCPKGRLVHRLATDVLTGEATP